MRGWAIITIGLAIAAIIRASSKAADHFDDAFANGDWPQLPLAMRGMDGPTETGGGGWQPSKPDRRFKGHIAHDKGANSR